MDASRPCAAVWRSNDHNLAVGGTGLASTDTLFKVLFALNRLEAVADMLKAQLRLVKFPKTLEGDFEPIPKVVHRVRHKRSAK